MYYIVLETLDGEPSVNLLTLNREKARERLYVLAVENGVVSEGIDGTEGQQTKKNVMEGKMIAFRDDTEETYRVDILEADKE